MEFGRNTSRIPVVQNVFIPYRGGKPQLDPSDLTIPILMINIISFNLKGAYFSPFTTLLTVFVGNHQSGPWRKTQRFNKMISLYFCSFSRSAIVLETLKFYAMHE